nr:reverse transcriptase domain-containing protein [Tanacetum cinerariifolium]
PSNTIANSRSDLKAITTRSGVSYDGPQISPPPYFLPKVVEDKPETTKDTVQLTNNESTEDVQPLMVQSESPVLNSEPVTSLISEPVIALVSALKPNPKSLIPYPSMRNDERNHEKANNQIEKFYQIFTDMSFKISSADALILMPKFALTLKALIGNKEKFSEMARTLLNEHCSAVLLKKLPKKLGHLGKFLIPCDFPGMAECVALADLGASINLMPFSVWKRLSLPDLTPTCMTLELADRLISHPVGVAEDVYVKVGSFHFPADFVVIDFDVDPRVPLILERSFLKTRRALINVFEGELTLHVSKEAITFNLEQTLKYSANYSDMTAKRIDVIDMACEEYSQKVMGFLDVISSGNPTPYYDPIVSTTSPTLTPFENSDFLLKEVDAFLAIEDDPTSSEELKICEAKSDKSSIDEPPEVKLKDLPPYLEYAFLKGDDKLPVIIAKYLSVEVKTALVTEFFSELSLPFRKDAEEANVKITEKETLAIVYAFKKFRSYLIMNKSIVYTDHSALKYLFAKKDSKARLLRWVLLIQEFTFKVIDTKGAENLAADHLSRLENPHQNVLDPKEINESFPLETLNLVSTRGNQSTPWFADFANHHAGNFVVKGMSS